MALVAADSADIFLELDAGDTIGSSDNLLDSQRNLFHRQIDQLKEIVDTQCQLTGINPLSQEMAAGTLSVKIGKRPRDLLNPKALKYMQSYFSIRDQIGKKEMREISAICGVTVSQVKDFFAGQRARVRRFIRLSRDKATRSEAPVVSGVEDLFQADESQPILVEPTEIAANTQIQTYRGLPTTPQNDQQVADTKGAGEAPSSFGKGESDPDIDSDDKKFLDDIFTLMRREKTFTGKEKLMEWILRIHNVAVLNWFLTKGGSTILAAWLSQAAQEEQTSFLIVIFKVLCHLPLQKLLPTEMSDILQAVNKLRFYRFSDISQRARILLSRWSKHFITSQKKLHNNSSKTASMDIVCKQSINEIIGHESWQSEVDVSEFLPTANQEYSRQSEPREKLKLLTATSDDSGKRHVRSVLSSKTKERRKVLLVEQPDKNSKAADRSLQIARAVSSNNSRPMSADDIQKAKMRAMFMQSKYGKIDQSSTENSKLISCQTNGLASASRTYQVHQHVNANSKLSSSISDKFPSENEAKVTSKKKSSAENQFENLANTQIKWKIPPAIKIDVKWSVAVGENSKEIEVQSQRNRREEETLYSCLQDIPLNPKEPWDLEMDFDDSLTLEIPTEQPPDPDIPDNSHSLQTSAEPVIEASAGTSAPASNVAPEPDLELLEVLLKNPDLVLALTSNRGMNLKSEEMVALLDLLKNNGNELAEMMNKLSQSKKENGPQEIRHHQPEPTSLPSPTPPSDAERMAWRSELSSVANPPVLQPIFTSPSIVAARPARAMQFAAPPPDILAPVLGLPPFALSLPQTPANVNQPMHNQTSSTIDPTSPSLLHSNLGPNFIPNIHPSALNSIPSTSMSPPIQTSSLPNLTSSHYSSGNGGPIVTPLVSDEESYGRIPLPAYSGRQVQQSLPPNPLPFQSAESAKPPPPRVAPWSAVADGAPGGMMLTAEDWMSRPARFSDAPSTLGASVLEQTPDSWTGRQYGVPEDRYHGNSVRERTPDIWTGGTYGLSDHPNPNDRYSSFAQNNYDFHSNRTAVFSSAVPQMQRRGDRNGSVGREELGNNWSSDGNNPVRYRDFRHVRAYNDEVGRDNGLPKNWAPTGSRDGHRFPGSRGWRDHEHSRR